MLDGILQDIRFAFRTLRASPGYAAVALLTLALGIGATTAIFSLVSGVLLRPLPYPESDRLVRVWEENADGGAMNGAWQNLMDWRESASSLESLTAMGGVNTATVLGLGDPLRVGVSAVSEGFFRTLGVAPAEGRGFRPEEHRAGVEPVAVVSDGFWRTHLGARPDFDATPISVAGLSVRVVGVMPPGFDFPGDVDVWYPAELTQPGTSRTAHNWRVVGRLAAGVTPEQADAELDAITAGFAEVSSAEAAQYGAFFPFSARVTPLRDAIVGDTQRPLWILLAASALLLLVACTNLAGTSLARGRQRQRELAVRLALGAGRGRVARQLFIESLVLALPGAALGVGLAAVGLRLVPAMASSTLPRMDAVSIDGWVLTFATLTAVAAAVLFGLLPALRSADGGTADELRGSRGTGAADRGAWRWLVGGEVALAVVLLVGCGLLIRSFYTVLSVEPGFRSEGVLMANLAPPAAKYADLDVRAGLYDAVLQGLRATPGVAAAGITARAPLTGAANGQIQVRDHDDVTADYHLVDAGYFAALDIPLLRGRLFEPTDREGTEHVVVVNRAFADMVWPGEDPIGRRITAGGMDNYWDQDRWATVVGVVENIHQHDLTSPTRPAYYFSYRQRPFRSWAMTVLVVPERGPAGALTSAVRDAIRAVDRDVPVSFQTMAQRFAVAVADRRFTMTVLGLFAAVALILAAVGIYGVVSYTVARRTREIGIRVALGARPASVRRLVQRDSLVGVAAGAGVGLAVALAATRVMASLLYEISPTDPLTLVAVLAALGATAWLAAWVPARRGTKVDPVEAIRSE